jgi:hypothetical protein
MNASSARILEREICSESTWWCRGIWLMSSFQNYAKLEAHFK